MEAQMARVEPVINDPTDESEAEMDSQFRPAASLSAEMIIRPDDAGDAHVDRSFPAEEASPGAADAPEPHDPIQRIRRSLKETDRGTEQPTIAYKPTSVREKRSLSWSDLVIYTACYFGFLLIAMYFLDVFAAVSVNELLGFGN